MQFFQESKEAGILLNAACEAGIIPIPKPKALQANITASLYPSRA